MSQKLKLAAWKPSPANFVPIRDLTQDELAKHESYIKPFTEATARLALFRILALNYREWRSHINSLLAAERTEREDDQLRLNQRMLNFLTISYAIKEHFERSYRKRYKKQPAKIEEYDRFVENLKSNCWAFAFFTDFRNYVQHCELPIGKYHHHVSHDKVALKISHDAKTLLANYKDWKASQLSESHGRLDLIALLQDYYIRMIQDYGRFVAKTFFPELRAAEEFYKNLTTEVTSRAQGHRMVFARDRKPKKELGKVTTNIQIIFIPNEVYTELGIVPNFRSI